MSRISTLLRTCGRGPVLAIAITSAAAFGLGLMASVQGGDRGRVITVQEGNNQEGQNWGDMDPEQMMAMMAQLGEPGEQHQELAVFVGQWDTTMEALTPGMEAFDSTGTATFEPVMGGRFIKQDFKGTMMGQPTQGVGLSGYNKASKQFEGVWYDSMSTALYIVKGEKTDTGWTYQGEETDPMSGQTFEYRHVIAMADKDNWHFTMQYPPEVAAQMGAQAKEGEKWVDAFRITYTRKGAGGGNGMGGNGGNGGGGNARNNNGR